MAIMFWSEDTVAGVEAIISGKYDDYSDDMFMLIGKVDMAEEKWKAKH